MASYIPSSSSSSSSSRRQICKARLHTKVSQTRLLQYAHSNSQLFRLRLNCSRVFALRMFEGRPFQVEGPAMQKLRLPKRVVSAPRWYAIPKTVTHPSTNPSRRLLFMVHLKIEQGNPKLNSGVRLKSSYHQNRKTTRRNGS